MFPSFRRDGFDTFGPGRSLRSASSTPGNTTTEYHENKTEIMGKILSFCLVLLWTIPTTAGNTWCPLQIEWFNTTTVEFYHDASKTYDMPYSGGSIQVPRPGMPRRFRPISGTGSAPRDIPPGSRYPESIRVRTSSWRTSHSRQIHRDRPGNWSSTRHRAIRRP